MAHRHAANVFWSGLEAGTSALLSFATAFVIAKLIGPSEFGVGAAAAAIHVLLWIAVNALFADPLVQRGSVDRTVFSTAFITSLAFGCVAALLQAALGPPLAWSLADSRAGVMSLVLALPLPLVGAAGPVAGLLTRNRDYRALAWRTLVGQGVGTIAGIAAAVSGAGAWAVVLQQFIASSAGAATLLLKCPMRPECRVDPNSLREMLRIGVPLTASTLVQHGRYRLFTLLIGATAGAAALGQVHMAFRLVDAVRELSFTAQWRLMLPILSERQHDLRALRSGLDRCLACSSVVVFPLCAAMAVSIEPMVMQFLGMVWQPAGHAALPLIALTAWLFLAFPSGVAVIARGEPRYALLANIMGTVATALGVLVVRPETPEQAVLVWLGAQVCVVPYGMWSNARVLRTGLLRPLRGGLPMLAGSLMAASLARLAPPVLDLSPWPHWQVAIHLLIVAIVCAPFALAVATQIGLLRLDRQRRIMARSVRPEPNGEA